MSAEPLAELHVHLEGTVRPATAAELAARHGVPPPPPYHYSDLPQFLAVYAEVCACMRTAEDFERVILEHAETMVEQGIAYAEVSVNPSLHPGGAWLDGLARGRRLAGERHGVELAWLVELVRGAPAAANREAVEMSLSLEGCVGLGLVGDESIDSAPLVPLIERARAAGLSFMPHAGQGANAAAVHEALDVLGAGRIAHGIAAASDEPLLRKLADRGTCLCVCPSSNRAIGLQPDLRRLAAAGITLTVNSDDPAMVGTTLRREIEIAETEFGLDRQGLVAAAWANRFRREPGP